MENQENTTGIPNLIMDKVGMIDGAAVEKGWSLNDIQNREGCVNMIYTKDVYFIYLKVFDDKIEYNLTKTEPRSNMKREVLYSSPRLFNVLINPEKYLQE